MSTAQVKPSVFVGIDVSKETLDIFVRPQGKSWKAPNQDFEKVVSKLKAFNPRLIILEPTGGHELGILQACIQAKLPIWREHALKIHHHAKGSGQLAKTDRLDASMMAHYGECYCEAIAPCTVFNQGQLHLQQLSARRQELVQMRTAEKNRAQAPALDEHLKADCEEHIGFLDERILRLEAELKSMIEANALLKERQQLLESMPGIAEKTSTLLLAYLPELGQVSRKKIGALAGVVPYKNRSGKYQGQEHIRGGRSPVRSTLYLATLSAVKHDARLKAYYQHLISQGKKKKVALVACMHKMLRMLNAMLAKGEAYCPR